MNRTLFKFKPEFFQSLFCPTDAEFELDNLLLFSHSRMSIRNRRLFFYASSVSRPCISSVKSFRITSQFLILLKSVGLHPLDLRNAFENVKLSPYPIESAMF